MTAALVSITLHALFATAAAASILTIADSTICGLAAFRALRREIHKGKPS